MTRREAAAAMAHPHNDINHHHRMPQICLTNRTQSLQEKELHHRRQLQRSSRQLPWWPELALA
jgi:hypothetical protein